MSLKVTAVLGLHFGTAFWDIARALIEVYEKIITFLSESIGFPISSARRLSVFVSNALK